MYKLIKKNSKIITFIILISFFMIISKKLKLNERNKNLKLEFEKIYENKLWGSQGNGSGPGSSIEFTDNFRNIAYNLVRKYKINSILDAPCGAMAWMPLLLRNLSNELQNFEYHGIDVVESVIDSLKIRFRNYSNWKEVYRICIKTLPPNNF
jgi:hypothetical protein